MLAFTATNATKAAAQPATFPHSIFSAAATEQYVKAQAHCSVLTAYELDVLEAGAGVTSVVSEDAAVLKVAA